MSLRSRYKGRGRSRIKTVTTTYTATVHDEVVICDSTSADFTITLPLCAVCKGKVLVFVSMGHATNNTTIDGAGSETVGDAANKVLGDEHDSLMILSDGTNWQILGSFGL